MKLRLTHNSIRVRVRKSELKTLVENQFIEETVTFPVGADIFSYTLVISTEINKLTAQYDGANIKILIPKQIAEDWIHSNTVGIEWNLDLANDESLHILIEKDFPCLDRPNEDKSDTFWELAPDHSDNC